MYKILIMAIIATTGVSTNVQYQVANVRQELAEKQEVLDTLYYLIENEARGEGLEGKILVADVIFNRVESDDFPSTIAGVMYQENQFCGMEDLGKFDITEETKRAVQIAQHGNEHGGLYFNVKGLKSYAYYNKKYIMTINNHDVYK